jgi:RNA polymerase sigma-70 factor (ECF subfamily)
MEIYLRYGPALLRKCERMLGNRNDAEDIVQELFTDLLKKGQSDESLAYLYRAATNRCLNLIRNRKKRHMLLEQNSPAEPPPTRTLLEEMVVGQELLSRLVDRLDKKAAAVLVYRYVDDLTQEEIATMTGLSRKTVGKRLGKIARVAKKIACSKKGGRP